MTAGACALVVLLLPGSVRAEAGGPWVIVPTTLAAAEPEPTHVRAAAAALELELVAAPGVLDSNQTLARFERRGSTAPLMVSHTDLDALARDAQMALYHVASGLHARARKDVERALARADRVLESLNRESIAAQQLLDACLYLVRAYLDGNQREKARAQALECRRLVPDVEPDGTMHPPHVIGLLAEAEAHLRLRTPGALRVESRPAGCAVFVNGRRLGTAPLELPQLSPGEYRVQAECGEGAPGRVHRVVMGATRVVVRIDTRFDSVVQTSQGAALRYPSDEARAEHASADATEIGRIVGAAHVVRIEDAGPAATDPATRIVYAERIRVEDGARVAAVRMLVTPEGELPAITSAARALRDGAHLDLTGPTFVPLATSPTPTPSPSASHAPPARGGSPREAGEEGLSNRTPPSSSPPASGGSPGEAGEEGPALSDLTPGPPTVPGIALAATGGAALATGWALWIRQLGLESDYRRALDSGGDVTSALDAVESSEPLAPIVGGVGAVAATASLPWLLPEADGVPAWAIATGAVGGAAAIGGAIFLARGVSCEDFDVQSRCTDTLSTTRFGALLLETAVPLGGIPVTYLLRHAFGGDTTASLSLARDAAVLRVGGSL